MRMRHSLPLASAWLLIGLATVAPAQQKAATKASAPTEAALRKTMVENIRSTEAEDLDAMMKTIHSGSPLFQQTRQQVSQIFGKGLGLRYQLVSFKYLATDGDYALARVRQRTSKTPPESFKNNEIDMIVAFRKEDDTWKFWSQAILEIKYLEP